MTAHKYAVGENVTFSPHRHEDSASRGVYTIVRLLPAAEVAPQYRIRAAIDGRERVVAEGQLTRPTH
jgi:hypothetical protein